MPGIVSLTEKDDDTLFMAASALANLADKLDSGEDIPELAQLLRVASMMVAAVMASAYERAIEAENSLI